MTTRIANKDAARLFRNLQPFQGSNFRGTTSFEGYGCMDRSLGHAFAVESADYVIYSYATPIAWHLAGVWVIPHTKFSVTTARHQSYVRRATA